jgi:hypothetical protein
MRGVCRGLALRHCWRPLAVMTLSLQNSKVEWLKRFDNTKVIERSAAVFVICVIIHQIPFAAYRIMMNVIEFLHEKILIVHWFCVK